MHAFRILAFFSEHLLVTNVHYLSGERFKSNAILCAHARPAAPALVCAAKAKSPTESLFRLQRSALGVLHFLFK